MVLILIHIASNLSLSEGLKTTCLLFNGVGIRMPTFSNRRENLLLDILIGFICEKIVLSYTATIFKDVINEKIP